MAFVRLEKIQEAGSLLKPGQSWLPFITTRLRRNPCIIFIPVVLYFQLAALAVICGANVVRTGRYRRFLRLNIILTEITALLKSLLLPYHVKITWALPILITNPGCGL